MGEHKAPACLRDGHGRVVDTLRLSITKRCNMRCIYCMPPARAEESCHGDDLPLAELAQMAQAAVACGIHKIRLTGGEPLVRNGIIELCRELAVLPGLQELCLTTNGLLLPALAKELRGAGVARVNLSLDSLRPERYAAITRVGTLRQALVGLDSALAANFSTVKLNMVLMGGINDDEIGDFISLTQELPIEVRFLELMPMGECAAWPVERFIGADEVLRRFPSLKPLQGQGVAQRFRMPGYRGTVGLIRPMSECFCGICSRIRITPDGMLKPCLHGSEETPLRGLRGEELMNAICAGVALKPNRHELLENGSHAGRRMSEIGG